MHSSADYGPLRAPRKLLILSATKGRIFRSPNSQRRIVRGFAGKARASFVGDQLLFAHCLTSCNRRESASRPRTKRLGAKSFDDSQHAYQRSSYSEVGWGQFCADVDELIICATGEAVQPERRMCSTRDYLILRNSYGPQFLCRQLRLAAWSRSRLPVHRDQNQSSASPHLHP